MVALNEVEIDMLEIGDRPGGVHLWAQSPQDEYDAIDRLKALKLLREIVHDNGYCHWQTTPLGLMAYREAQPPACALTQRSA